MKNLTIKKLNEIIKHINDNWTPEDDARIHRDTVRYNRSCAHMGLRHSPQTKAAISAALKGRAVKLVVCPHCSKQGGVGAMHRWHFNQCKANLSAR
ncbi:hypothetical protein [Undibacterium sp. Ji22W]|uniref:hypothetical protein n=1 Tax=Undibacterium sp. Ji22W TaxID=3413038 RepID=UPI003BF123C0